MPVYRDPDAEWLWNSLCAITQKNYKSNNLAFAWMVGFLITLIVELMRNDSTVRAKVIRKLRTHYERTGSISNKQSS